MRCFRGKTPLHLACEADQDFQDDDTLSICQLLIEHGARLDLLNQSIAYISRATETVL